MSVRKSWGAVLAGAWLLSGASALAQPVGDGPSAEGSRLSTISDADKKTAKLRVASGDQRFRDGDYAGALDDYQAADTIMGVPTTAFEVGRTLVVLERYRQGRAALERVLAYPESADEPEAFVNARTRARAAIADLEAKVPTITVRVVGAKDVDATLDGRSIALDAPQEIDPGAHRVVVRAAGFEPEERTLEVASGAHPEVVINLRSEDDDEQDTPTPPVVTTNDDTLWPVVTWIGVGVAGAGLIVGGVMGGLSLAKASDFEAQQRADGTYPESARGLQDDTLTFAHVSTVGFVVAGAGAALAAVGLVFMLSADGGEGDSAARLTLGVSGATLTGSF